MKKIWILATVVMCFFTFYQITSSYAKYVTEVSGELEQDIGKWYIEVNSTNISSRYIITRI